VKGVSSASEIPVKIDRGEIDWGEKDGDHNKIARVIWTNADFLTTFEVDLLQGEYFTTERDSLNYDYVVVNRGLVDYMGWEDPVGREMHMWDRDRIILGIVEDISFFPLKLPGFDNEALIYVYEPVQDYLFLRVVPGTSSKQLSAIEEVFQKHNPGYELEYDYVSKYNIDMLQDTDSLTNVLKIFSGIAIFIAIMGLIGLSQFNNSRRTKEIGIHKVMGAQSESLVRLLLSEFIKLVMISNLVALPLAYMVLWRIFKFFTYSTELKIQVFIIVFVLSVLLALGTVTFHALRTARSNPVKSLRYE